MTEDQTPAPEAGDEVVADAAQDEQIQDQAEPDQDDTSEDQSDADKSDDEVSKSKARRERRKAELERTRQERDRTRQERDEAEAAAAKLAARVKQLEDQSKSTPPPKQSDFANYDEYLMALSAHNSVAVLDKRDIERTKQENEQAKAALEEVQRREKAELAQRWSALAEDARTRYADFDKVVQDQSLPISQNMATMAANSDFGADVVYYLGTHKSDAARIARLTPTEQARAFGALEARMEFQAQTRIQSHTQAPDPTEPVRPRATARKDPGKMTSEEYRKARMAGQL